MAINLIQSLQEIKDFRTSRGRRYPLWLILLLVIMGTISGCRSYYALEDFGVRHYGAVSEKTWTNGNSLAFGHDLPSRLTKNAIFKVWHSSLSNG